MTDIISFEELASEIDVPKHIIHLWTKKFPILNPQRNANGKVGFKNRDVMLARGLRKLLIYEKNAIRDVQALINERGVNHIIDVGKQANPLDIIRQEAENMQKPSFNGTHYQDIKQKTFSKINQIFSTDKKKKDPLDTHIVSDQIKAKASSESENTTNKAQDSHQPASHQETYPEVCFEDNWRHLMEKSGKATPIDEARKKASPMSQVSLEDIWEIDDEVILFPHETEINALDIHSQDIKKAVVKTVPASSDMSSEKHKVTHMHQSGLTIEQEETVRHLIAKLDIIKEELVLSGEVICETLQSFGFSTHKRKIK